MKAAGKKVFFKAKCQQTAFLKGTAVDLLADLTKRGKMDFTSLTPSAGAVSVPPSS
jgi:hypothetical protein